MSKWEVIFNILFSGIYLIWFLHSDYTWYHIIIAVFAVLCFILNVLKMDKM